MMNITPNLLRADTLRKEEKHTRNRRGGEREERRVGRSVRKWLDSDDVLHSMA